ncbi:MAG: VanZ family protein [bacterium]|nr:VanZ family protein [bacterium]
MKKEYFIVGLFIAYLILLIKVIAFKYPSSMVFDVADGNYVPFKTIVSYLMGQPTWTVAIYNIGGNIVSFIPLGFFVPILYKQRSSLKHVFIFAFSLSFAIECMQVLLSAGIFDVDDIILNILGAVVGYVFVLIFHVHMYTAIHSIGLGSKD